MRSSRHLALTLSMFAGLFAARIAVAGPQPESDRSVTIVVSASEGAFDTELIKVPAGARVILEFTNADGVPRQPVGVRHAGGEGGAILR